MKMIFTTISLAVLALCLGCESNASNPTQEQFVGAPSPPAPAAPSANAAAAGARANAAAEDTAEPVAETTAADAPPPAASPPAAADPSASKGAAKGDTLKKAEVGVGRKGKDYGGPGFITTPVAAKFAIEDRIAFDVQIPKAMQLYKVEHGDKGPKTHEEFFQVIIKEHGVALPTLYPGESYIYIPETEELMVKVPKKEE